MDQCIIYKIGVTCEYNREALPSRT